ncbi:hypothetical protein ATS75_12600 [Pseudoalteromonas sp. H105]|nr:hypothetical protein ATS75_12600 [Pseudoalteromonas sp. H105]
MLAPKISLSVKNNGVLANKKRIESALLFHLVMELDYFLQKQIKRERYVNSQSHLKVNALKQCSIKSVRTAS